MTKPKKAQALAKPLPGEASVAKDLVDQAVQEINRLYVAKGLETARVVGEYVLKTFFDGRPENLRKRGRRHVSFRKLVEHEDLRVSHVFLWNAVRFVEQLRQLPGNIGTELPFSHHKLLLPVRDEQAKVALAKKAVENDLSTRELEEEVRKVRRGKGTKGGAGRRPLPAFVKAFARLAAIAKLAASEKIGSMTFEHFPKESASQVLHRAWKDIKALGAVYEEVRSQLAPGGEAKVPALKPE
jgi:hypothetical protein